LNCCFLKTPILAIFDAITAIWLLDAIMAIWPYSYMAIMASNVGNMGVFRDGNKNVAIW
jgi:hypothetical protein